MTTPAPSPQKPWSCILFDLDGTITDSAPGIIGRLSRTLIALGRPVPLPAELVHFVGPPILEGFELVAGMNQTEATEALGIYRALAASEGPQDDAVTFPGMVGLVRFLHKAGVPLAITTSKSEVQAHRILEHLRLEEAFVVITGSSEDESRSAKGDVIAEALVRLREAGVDLSNLVLVGDRIHDMEGAAEHGIPPIMVEWGYGSPAEAAGAIAVVHSVDQLRSLLV
ncbi:HAD hydrolase-like protein [Subtercola boreus]|uniref:Haloacid dehalogenase n=1 Tax=Subtercola boreus TaxID=120213 RepID=A0A3E0WF97_9MICO|nr:HAD hydrolase-like protein [Subtercola boreus]RFA23465.1 haloacid dehalogenase [Subtercola boreus]RFA23858.1 haloacid dehalogenase [Subtercola boreus]RFA29559.1 haloacid dehalogenase [Subtercola boreus]